MENFEQTKQWYKQPLVWMLIVIPGSAVVAGFITLYLAIVSFDGMVVDDYYKHGKEINRVLKRDRRANELGLRAVVVLNPATDLIELRLAHNKGFGLPERLKLRFLHTTRAGYDQMVAMISRGNSQYAGTLPVLRPGSWDVLLEDTAWRISGRLENEHQQSLNLAPAFK